MNLGNRNDIFFLCTNCGKELSDCELEIDGDRDGCSYCGSTKIVYKGQVNTSNT